ncbi:hypothetical protein AB833_18465 [Chromatiales bacterium (ex Bugula neritina AB1)]|nr:hypothetical protein AB833_18465 [Chromatiales bacterium (ex Bugula neritina AB1)]
MSLRTLYLASCVSLSMLLVPPAAFSEDFTIGKLTIANPHTRATPPGARTAAGYAIIRNNGDTADRLTGGSAGFAEITEIHEMSMHGDVMKMRQLEDGLEIPAGGEVTLKSGGLHMMYMQLKKQLIPGEQATATFTFEHAGEVQVKMDIVPISGNHAHGSMNQKKKEMKHGESTMKSDHSTASNQ